MQLCIDPTQMVFVGTIVKVETREGKGGEREGRGIKGGRNKDETEERWMEKKKEVEDIERGRSDSAHSTSPSSHSLHYPLGQLLL